MVPEQTPGNKPGEQQVEDRTGGHNKQFLPGGVFGKTFLNSKIFRQFFPFLFSHKHHIAAQRYCRQLIVSFAAGNAEKPGPQAQRKFGYADPKSPSHQKVAQFMEENQASNNEDYCNSSNHIINPML